MQFRVAFVGTEKFGSSDTEISKRIEARLNDKSNKYYFMVPISHILTSFE
jgi:hypothetical protein